jgi:hypothetical protein
MKDILRGRYDGIKIDTTKTFVFTQDIPTQVRYFLLNYSVIVKRFRNILSTIVNINKKMEFRIVPTKKLGYTFNLNDYRVLLLKVRIYNLPKYILT